MEKVTELKMFESTEINNCILILKVPAGYIYRFLDENTNHYSPVGTFIPNK